MAEAVETMVSQAAPSVLADEMMCPALREFGAPAQAYRQTPDPTGPAHHSWPPAHDSLALACMQARAWTTPSVRR